MFHIFYVFLKGCYIFYCSCKFTSERNILQSFPHIYEAVTSRQSAKYFKFCEIFRSQFFSVVDGNAFWYKKVANLQFEK